MTAKRCDICHNFRIEFNICIQCGKVICRECFSFYDDYGLCIDCMTDYYCEKYKSKIAAYENET